MKITICGSMSHVDKMKNLKLDLKRLGHIVEMPQIEILDSKGNPLTQKEFEAIRKSASNKDRWVWDINQSAMRTHFEKITKSDAILISNYEKNNIPNYIGPNTLMEMGLALFLNKKIFLLNPIPNIPSKEEILGVNPRVLNGNLKLIINTK